MNRNEQHEQDHAPHPILILLFLFIPVGFYFSCGDSTTTLIADPKLAPLRDNGGPSPTHALTAESPAFNAMGPCGIAVDQRYTRGTDRATSAHSSPPISRQ